MATEDHSTPAVSAGDTTNPLTLIWEAWKALGTNVTPLILVFLAMAAVIVVPISLVLIFYIALHSTTVGLVIDGIVGVLAVLLIIWMASALGVAFFRIALANARGQKVEFKDVWQVGQRRWFVYFVASLLTVLAVLGGLILLIVPGIIFGVWFSLMPLAVADGQEGAVASMKHSRNLLRGHGWEMFALIVVIEVLSSVLQIVPLVGPIAAILVGVTAPTAYAMKYLELSKLALKADHSA